MTEDHDTALQWAVKENHLSVVKALLGATPINTELLDAAYCTPLVVAVRQRQLHHVRHLLRCPHLFTDKPGPDGVTPLHMAIQQLPRNRRMITAMLAVTRVNTEQHDLDDMSPLHVAIRDADDVMFHELVGVPRTDLDHADPHGLTALMRCCGNGQLEYVRTLLALPQRSTLNAQDPHHGWTALMHAVHGGHYDVVLMMLRLVTVDVTLVTKDDPPLDVVGVAMLRPHFDVRRLVRGRMAAIKLMKDWVKRIREEWAKENEGSEIDYDDF